MELIRAIEPATGRALQTYRTPPHNAEAEQALLGAMLINNAVYQRVSEFLLPDHFAEALHGRIYEAIAKVIERGQIANPITLKGYFETLGTLDELGNERAGGAAYLARLAASVVTIINAHDYAQTIYDAYLRRQLIEVGTEIVNDAYEHEIETEAKDLIEMAEAKLFKLGTEGVSEGGFLPFNRPLTVAIEIAEQAYKHSGRTSGLSTGFIDMDKMLGGLHPSDLVILAGRPSMGKTALATNIAYNVARTYRQGTRTEGAQRPEDGGIVGFFSLEMSAEQIATRILAEASGVSGEKILKGEVSREEFERFAHAASTLQSIPLFIDATPGLTISALRTRARRLKRRQGLHLLVVDYLQLLSGPPTRGERNRVQEISEITRGLKGLAKELDLPVIALSQLSRAVEQRDDKRPQLADLRESGTIEQDADVVMFVFREEYYLQRSEPMRKPEENQERYDQRYDEWKERFRQTHGLAEVIIGKQRRGRTGNVKMHFDGETTKFSDYVSPDHLPDAHY